MKTRILIFFTVAVLLSCDHPEKPENEGGTDGFSYQTEQFADIRILRYQVPGFDTLTLKQKKLVYYLSQAALCGRDITCDQNCRYNLLIRKSLEAIYQHSPVDRTSEAFKQFEIYLKRVWFSNGIHHHYSTDKFFPEINREYFMELLMGVPVGKLPLGSQSQKDFAAELTGLVFDPDVAPKRVSLDDSGDLIKSSSTNFYEDVSQSEAEEFYEALRESDRVAGRDTRIAYGLNSKLIKENGRVRELTYRAGGLYSGAIAQITGWLEKAAAVAETEGQREVIVKLIDYYNTGDLVTWDEYNVAWVKDERPLVDFVNGFIEVYGDPLAMKGTWEALVNFKDVVATRRTEILSENASFFEAHSPVDPAYKKKEVKGVTAKVVIAAQLGGDCHPATPIGINLPNSGWIRKEYGSKSVTIDNITYAYHQAARGNGFLEEFAWSDKEIDRARQHGYLAGCLMTDLHECLGHGSGQLRPGVTAESLKNYHSAIEETRADLFALYYIRDPEMVNLGLVPDYQVAMAAYDNFMMNGLITQLVRIQPGRTIEESHMRDRALIARWVYEKCRGKNIVELVQRDGKTYVHILDYDNLRWQFGEMLKLIQRITSEGDYREAKSLVDRYAIHVDPELHREVLERYARLKIAPYAGFINPEYVPVLNADTIADVKISYPDDFAKQMMYYSNQYSFIPVVR